MQPVNNPTPADLAALADRVMLNDYGVHDLRLAARCVGAVDVMREALTIAAGKFRHYADHHLRKGDMEKYRANETLADIMTSALDAIAAIMQPQWLPVAGLVRDGRGVLAGGWDDYGGEFETQFVEASDVCSYAELTHYCELPAALPPKPDGV